MRDGKLLGVLDLVRLTPGITFSDSDIAIVQLFSAQAAIAITNARLYYDANEAARLKSEFVATFSHELRTPMGAIMGYTELLTSGSYGNIPDTLHDPLNRLKANAAHLLTLINQMLDLSQIEAGRLQLHQEPLSTEDLLKATVAAVQQEAHNKNLGLHTSMRNNVPSIVLADVGRLRQILINLVDNSIKFTQRGSVTLSCAYETPTTGPQLVFEVSDTGPGIAANRLALIWQPFRQVDGSETRSHHGSGLGLAIVERLSKLMGGSVMADSALGVGSIFSVRIPVEIPRQ